MTPPAELLEQFQSTKRDQGVEVAAQNLFRDIYGDVPQTAAVLTTQQIEERQIIADGLSEQGLLPQLSIAWVNKYSAQIDANGDGLVTDVEVENFADLLDGQDDGEVSDPLARRLFENFASQYDRMIVLSSDGTSVYQRRMVTAFENEDVFNALDTAGYGGEGDRRVGWHDLNNIINNPGQFPELIDQLATMGVTIEDLTYMRDNWDSPVVEQLMDDSGDLISPESIAAARAELDNSIQGINDESGRLTYIMLPGTTAFWMRSGDVWTHYLAPNQVDSSYANVDVSADPPPVLNTEDGTISFHHSDGSQSDIQYDDQGNVTQVTQTSNGQTAQATLNADGTVVSVSLPDGSTIEQNPATGVWEHRMGATVLGNVAGPPVVSPDGFIGFNYGYEVAMDSWKLFDGQPGRWRIALNQDLASTDDPVLVEVHNPDETFHYVMRYSDTSLDYAQIRFNNGATVILEDNQINMITLPDGSTVEPLDASLPRDQWVWVHKQTGEEPVPVGVPQLNSDGQLTLRSGEQTVDMFPYLANAQVGDETHYDLILSNGSTETFNGNGQRIRWSLGSSAVIEYDAATNSPTSFTAGGNVWRLSAETNTWTLNGEPTAIIPQFSSNEEGDAVSFVNEDGTRTVYRANGVSQTEYGNGIVATSDASGNVELVDLPGDALFSQVNGQWVFQGPDAALCDDVALVAAPEVLPDGTVILALADGSTRHMRFDENGYVVEIADTGTLEPPQTILRSFENGLMIAMVLPNGRTTEFQYDENDEAIVVSLTVSGNTQTWTRGSDGRWMDSDGNQLNALEVTEEGILNIWAYPNNELTTYLLDGTSTSNIYHPLQSGGNIDAVEVALPNGDSAVLRGGIPLQVTTDGVTVNFDSQGNEVSVDLLDGTRLIKGEDGTWLHVSADGTTIGPVAAVDANFDVVNGAELTSGGHSLFDANGNLNLLRPDGAIEIYDSAGNLRSVNNGSLSASFNTEGELNVVNMPDGSRWVFDPTTSNWHHSVFRAQGPDFVADGQVLDRESISMFEGGVRINSNGGMDQVLNFDGSIAQIYPNQLIVRFPSGSETFNRIETVGGQPFLYQDGAAWVMHIPPAEAQLVHLSQPPQVNADGSITLNYADGSALTYQFNQESGTLESVAIDRPGEQGFVFLTYRDGQISRAVFSTDNASDANDYSVSQDGEDFYSYGGAAQGRFELSPNGVLTMNGQIILTGDGSFMIPTERGIEYHEAGGTFRLIDNEGQTIAQQMQNGTTYETDGLTVTSVRFANGATISYDANANQWIYRIDGTEAIVSEPLLDGDQLIFRVGGRTIPMFNDSDNTFNIVNEDGMIETFSAEGTRMRLATADGALVFLIEPISGEYARAQIGEEAWSFDVAAQKWRSADGRLAEITPTADGVTVSYEDNTVVEYLASGAISDITFPSGAAISYAADGTIDAIETSGAMAWQLQNGTWIQVGGPQTGTVLIGVNPAGGNPLNGDSVVFTFADSSSYRITSAGIWEQVTQAIVAETAPEEPDVVPQSAETTLAGGVVVSDHMVNGVREVVITVPGQSEPSRIVYDLSGQIASVFRPDGSELRFNSTTNAYDVYRRNVTSNVYEATSEVWSGTLDLNNRTFVLTFTPQNIDGILRVEYRPDGSWTTFGADYRELHNVNQSVVRYERVNGIEGVTEVTYPNSTARQFEYDPAGNLIRMIVTPPGQIYMPSDGNPSHWDEYVSDGGNPPVYTRVPNSSGIDGSLSVDRDGNFIVRHSDGSYQIVMTDGSAPTEAAGGAYQMTTTERSDLAADLNADPLFWRSFTDQSGRIDMVEVDALYADLSSVPNPSARQIEQIDILRRIQDSREAFIAADGTPILITEFITENLVVSTTYPVADVEVPVINPANTFVFPSNITVSDMASISLVRQGVFTPDAFNNPHTVELMQSMGLIPEGVTSFNQLLANAEWRAQNGIPAGVTNAQQLFDHLKSTGRISAAASGWSEIRSAEEVRVMELNSYRSDRGAAPLESPAGSGRYLRGWNSIAVGQVFILPPAIEQPALAGAA